MAASDPEAQPWGFLVYRTVYTPESNAVWDSVTSKLENYLSNSSSPSGIKRGKWAAAPRLWYMDDAALYDSLSIDQVRDDFTIQFFKNIELSNQGAYEVFSRGAHDTICLVIDNEVIHSIIDAPEDVSEAKQLFKRPTLTPKRPIPYIKAVDRHKPPKPNPPKPLHGSGGSHGREKQYPGWMKAGLLWVGDVYPQEEMEIECPEWDPNLGDESYPVYQGVPASFFDY
ncbi:Hypothetical protein GIQ15_01947 [Arthroderma uncinatum]|uniref:Hypothetical protein n=1 Tax=Arthroderma uncinatum TaxID=74035 RepID=UPI00144AC95B|nr:Hypothetical protein GIQ15_01947 [Arthroderma uncinatum]KAF3492430.1 Hypothetical protein GIQ15_01947 [Arthroderma uncinatum]